MTDRKLERIDRDASRRINEAVQAALAPVADGLGLNVEVNGGRYDPATGTFKPRIEFSLPDSGRKAWERDVRNLDFSTDTEAGDKIRAEDYGAEVTIPGSGRTYRLTGINLRAPKYPVVATEVKTGKSFKLTEDAVRRALGRRTRDQAFRAAQRERKAS